MLSDGEDVIKSSEIVRELIIVEMPTLSELEYNSIVDDVKCVIHLFDHCSIAVTVVTSFSMSQGGSG